MLNKYEHYVIEEADFHLQRAKEILEEGMLDPEKYYRESRQHYEHCVKCVPFLYLMSQRGPQARKSNL